LPEIVLIPGNALKVVLNREHSDQKGDASKSMWGPAANDIKKLLAALN